MVVFGLLARRIGTPYPIVLVVAGLALSLVPGIPRIHLNPRVVFLVILPPLLYSAAWTTSWREFRHNLVSIISVACGLVAFTVVGVAFAAQWLLPGFDWRIGLILGAVVAPTDAVAAAAIASQIGLPRQIVDLLEGESLVNDATGLLALEFGLALALGAESPTVGMGLLRFGYLVAAGLGVGAAVAFVVAWVERQVDDGPLEITISVLVPYAAYLGAEAIHASGVLAVVASGLMLSRWSSKLFSPTVRLQVYAVWNSAVFMLNGVVFVLIGLQLPEMVAGLTGWTLARLIGEGALLSALVLVLRVAWLFPGARLSYFIRNRVLGQTDTRPSGRALLVFGWSGMRGVVSLAAAIALPLFRTDGGPFEQRSLIIFLTFSVVIWTLVVQGLTLAPLIRALGLAGASGSKCEEEEAHQITIEAALAHLDEMRSHDDPKYASAYDDVSQHYLEQLEALTGLPSGVEDAPPLVFHKIRELTDELHGVQRRTLLRLRYEGRINDQVLRNLERELDLQDARST